MLLPRRAILGTLSLSLLLAGAYSQMSVGSVLTKSLSSASQTQSETKGSPNQTPKSGAILSVIPTTRQSGVTNFGPPVANTRLSSSKVSAKGISTPIAEASTATAIGEQTGSNAAPMRYTSGVQDTASKPSNGTNQIEVWAGGAKELVSIGQNERPIQLPVTQDNTSGQWSSELSQNSQGGTTDTIASTVPAETHSGSKPPASWFSRRSGVSDGFVAEINDALSTLPQAQLNALAHSGFKVVTSKLLTDVVPNATTEQVRGYEARTSWNTVYGMFNRTSKLLVMAEMAEHPTQGLTGLTPLMDKERRLGIVRHEFGHAMDQYLGNYSHNPEFLRAFARDSATLLESDRKSLSYFLQPGEAGAEETFAELFACNNGRGCDQMQDQILKSHFGDLMSMLQAKLAQVKA